MSEAEEDAFDQWAAMPDHLRPPLNGPEQDFLALRNGECPDHDPNTGPGSDYCPRCGQYAVAE